MASFERPVKRTVGDRRQQGRVMNIAYFLTPKRDVVWVAATGSLRQAVERMRPNGFAAVPLLNDEGGYVGTLTEGDILWHLLDEQTKRSGDQASVLDVKRRTTYGAVHIDAEIEALIACAENQNFVPVVDDREVFIGIVRRKSIISHCARLIARQSASNQGAANAEEARTSAAIRD